jgi:hypothetical protein
VTHFLRRTVLLAALLASAVLTHAGVSYEESPAFAFDTRDSLAGLAAESASLVFDTRDYLAGLMAESASFVFDTRAVDGLSGLAMSGVFVLNTSFASAPPLQLTGTVRDHGSVPLAGATVTLKRFETVFWRGTTAVGGMFSAPNLSPWNYTVVVTKPGYVTYISNYTGSAGGSQPLDITLQHVPTAPPLVAVSRQPTEPETRVPQVGVGNQPKLLAFDGNSSFTSNAPVYPDRPTVVLAHGWQPDLLGLTPAHATDWCLDLASRLHSRYASQPSLGLMPNVLVWDWRHVAFTEAPQTNEAAVQGEALGAALIRKLGTGYARHVHFIGHSLGTIVNAYACDHVHGSFPRPRNNPPTHWSSQNTSPHVTLLDEAEIANPLGVRVAMSARLGWQMAGLGGALVATAARIARDWKGPVPHSAWWIDNYISLVGFRHEEAVTVCLMWPSVSTLNVIYAHGYSHEWYRRTIPQLANPPSIGFQLALEAGGVFPPSGDGRNPGDLWYQNTAANDALNLLRDSNPQTGECLKAILRNYSAMAEQKVVARGEQAANAVLDGFETKVEQVKGTSTVMQKSGTVASEVVEKSGFLWDAALDTAIDVANSIDPNSLIVGPLNSAVLRLNLTTMPAPQANRAQRDGRADPTNTPAHAWMTVEVPPDAGLIAFDFTVTGDPVDDCVVCAVGGRNVFSLPARFAPDGSPVSTDMMDISAHAGQSVELFFGLVGGTSTNCTVAVDGIRFVTIPEPKLGLVVNGPNLSLKWPTAAVGWLPITSDTLAPDSWQPVSMTAVTVEQGVATITQPDSGQRRFYRLRRNP